MTEVDMGAGMKEGLPEGDAGAGVPMPEFRMDPLSRRWVILAQERSLRPGSGVSGVDDPATCPFCPGNIEKEAIWSIPSDEKGGPVWRLILIPNKYPALSPDEEELEKENGTRRSYSAKGFHEIVVHSPVHEKQIGDMTPAELELILFAYRRRYRELAEHPFVKEIAIVSNNGHAAGASLRHSHSQIFTLPYVSHYMHEEVRHSLTEEGACVPCAILEEAGEDERVVVENASSMAFMPYASALPFETWFMTKRHEPYFSQAADEELQGVAEALLLTVRALSSLYSDAAYNLYVRSAPCDGRDYGEYHWRLGLLPRLTTPGGFEMSTHIQIEVVSPEKSASELRRAIGELT